MKQLLFLAFITISLSAVAQKAYPYLYKTKMFEGVLFGKSENIFMRSGATDPKLSDIDTAEKWVKVKIDSVAQSFNSESKVPVTIVKKFNQYKRQYFAYYNDKREKIIIMSFLHRSALKLVQWRMRPIRAADGWDDFWRISFNSATKELSDFYVNGFGG